MLYKEFLGWCLVAFIVIMFLGVIVEGFRHQKKKWIQRKNAKKAWSKVVRSESYRFK